MDLHYFRLFEEFLYVKYVTAHIVFWSGEKNVINYKCQHSWLLISLMLCNMKIIRMVRELLVLLVFPMC